MVSLKHDKRCYWSNFFVNIILKSLLSWLIKKKKVPEKTKRSNHNDAIHTSFLCIFLFKISYIIKASVCIYIFARFFTILFMVLLNIHLLLCTN